MTEKPAPSPVRAVLYARQSVSDEEGVENQLEETRARCEANGWEVVKEFADDGVSATRERLEETQWFAMLEMLRSDKANAVVATAPDRLARSIVDIPALRETKARIVTTRQGIDTAEPFGNLLLSLLVVFAEMEIANKKQRAEPFALARHEAGHPEPGLPPFGYRWVPKSERKKNNDETRWKVVEDEEKVVKWAFEEAQKGEGINLGEMCSQMNEKGWRTRTTGKRKGVPWRSTSLRRMLINPAYASLLVPLQRRHDPDNKLRGKKTAIETVSLDDCKKGSWTHIVELKQLKAVRYKLLDERKIEERRTNGGSVARKHLLPSLALCGRCLELQEQLDKQLEATEPEDKELAGEESNEEQEKAKPLRRPFTALTGVNKAGVRVYRCRNFHMSRVAQPVDDYIMRLAIWRLSQDDASELLLPDPSDEVMGLEVKKSELRTQAKTLDDMGQTGLLSVADWSARKLMLTDALEAVEASLKATLLPDPLSPFRSSQSGVEAWEALGLASRREVIQTLFPRIVIYPLGKGNKAMDDESVARTVHVDFVDGKSLQAEYQEALAEGWALVDSGELTEEEMEGLAADWIVANQYTNTQESIMSKLPEEAALKLSKAVKVGTVKKDTEEPEDLE